MTRFALAAVLAVATTILPGPTPRAQSAPVKALVGGRLIHSFDGAPIRNSARGPRGAQARPDGRRHRHGRRHCHGPEDLRHRLASGASTVSSTPVCSIIKMRCGVIWEQPIGQAYAFKRLAKNSTA